MKNNKRFIIIAVLLIAAVSMAACNRTVFDTKYKFTKAHIRINDKWLDVDVKSWRDYEGEQIQLILTDGTTMIIHSRDCILYKGTLPTEEVKDAKD